LLLLAAPIARLTAQDAETITGHVTADSFPVRGANLSIPELGLSTTTNADGRYTFIISSTRVRGQPVTLTARYLRFPPQSVTITLVGGTLVRDFEMHRVGGPEAESISTPVVSNQPRLVVPAARLQLAGPLPLAVPFSRTVDSSAFEELAGPTDLAGALAGRVPGLTVTSAATANGTSALVFRGPRSIAGPLAPLFVVDGFPIDASNLNARSVQFGLGGFDYGAALRDLDIGDVASVTVLDPAEAVLRYGGRASNGVVLITTKSGRGLHGFDVAASQQVTADTPLRLSTYQNAYGQGLDGAFSFFNGTGGGTNDAAAESWGPALRDQPIPQASYTEPRRPDVRLWSARPNDARDFFAHGHTYTTRLSAQGGGDRGDFRIGATNQSIAALSPSATSSRQTVTANGARAFNDHLSAALSGQFVTGRGTTLPGTGFNAGNPVAGFAIMGRQVDVAALKTHVVDTLDNQINWIYTNQNNPYFQSVENSNDTHRSRVLGGGSLTYQFTPAISVTGSIGTDSYHETRDFTIAPSWMGGFPYEAGLGDFSTGGYQRQGISLHDTNMELFARGTPAGGRLTLTAGVAHRSSGLSLTTVGADSVPSPAPTSQRFVSDIHTEAVFAGAHLAANDFLALDAAVRDERLSAAGGVSTVYPSVRAQFDAGRASRALTAAGLGSTRLRASWGRTGNQLLPAQLRSVYFGVDSTGAPLATPANSAKGLEPEITSTFDVGLSLDGWGDRLGLDVDYYHANGSNLLLPGGLVVTTSGTSSAASVASERAAALVNNGFAAQLRAVPLRTTSGLEWTATLDYAMNRSRVDALEGSVGSVALGPSLWGLTVEARKGESLPVLVGTGYLRDKATHALLLENGHPLPDSLDRRVLGTVAPAWTGSLGNSLRFRAVQLDFLLDAQVGGHVFSATNMWGQVSGNLIETAYRPDSGLLISGIDVATGKPNTQHVSAQSYFHSLLPINEAWVYDASFLKLRDARLSVDLPLHWLGVFTAQSLRASVIGRNLYLASRAPNIDPETTSSSGAFQGAELGQLPTVRSVGFQLSIVP
jgi:hypothetical protein